MDGKSIQIPNPTVYNGWPTFFLLARVAKYNTIMNMTSRTCSRFSRSILWRFYKHCWLVAEKEEMTWTWTIFIWVRRDIHTPQKFPTISLTRNSPTQRDSTTSLLRLFPKSSSHILLESHPYFILSSYFQSENQVSNYPKPNFNNNPYFSFFLLVHPKFLYTYFHHHRFHSHSPHLTR